MNGTYIALTVIVKKQIMSIKNNFVSMTTKGEDQFDGIFEMYPTSIKKLYVVDGGLSFNSPYPLLLRPQRSVDLILSFDFSARATDTTPPFKVKHTSVYDVPVYVLLLCFIA